MAIAYWRIFSSCLIVFVFFSGCRGYFREPPIPDIQYPGPKRPVEELAVLAIGRFPDNLYDRVKSEEEIQKIKKLCGPCVNKGYTIYPLKIDNGPRLETPSGRKRIENGVTAFIPPLMYLLPGDHEITYRLHQRKHYHGRKSHHVAPLTFTQKISLYAGGIYYVSCCTEYRLNQSKSYMDSWIKAWDGEKKAVLEELSAASPP